MCSLHRTKVQWSYAWRSFILAFLTETKIMKSMSELFRYGTLSAIVCGLAACTTAPSITVKTDYDHSASFGKYHTYVLDTAATGLGPTNNAVLEQALRSSLAARGLKERARMPASSSFRLS
jgi:hypothetical protein